MNNNTVITELKKSLDDLYNDFKRRINPKEWKNVLKPAYEADNDETPVAVIDFLQTHSYMPTQCWHTIGKIIQLRNNAASLSLIFNEEIICQMLYNMVNQNPVSYDYFPVIIDENSITTIMNTANDVMDNIDHLQIYKAEQGIARLKKLCPKHPDIANLQKKLEKKKENIIEIFVNSVAPNPADEVHTSSADVALMLEEDRIDDAVSYYENLIANDYQAYFAYYPLGCLYIEKGLPDQADYLSDILFDLDSDYTGACLLKGKYFEHECQNEDALFFYDAACRNDPEYWDAFQCKQRIIELMDSARKDNFHPYSPKPVPTLYDLLQEKKYTAQSENTSNSSSAIIDKLPELDSILSSLKEYMKRRRFSAAYYDLVSFSTKYPDSEILKFLQGYILYLLNKETAARKAFQELCNSPELGKFAEEFIKDIDYKIIQENIFEEEDPLYSAKINFEAKRFNNVLSLLANVPAEEMTSEAYVIKGRSEIACSKIKKALTSLKTALKLDPKTENIRDLIGMLYQTLGDEESAMENYDDAIKLESNPTRACSAKADLLYRNGRFDELLDFRNQISDKLSAESAVDGYAGLTLINDLKKDESNGRKFLENTINAGIRMESFYLALINNCIKVKQYYKALSYTEDGFFYFDNQKEFYTKKTEILFFLEQYRPAELIVGMLLTDKPESPELQYICGMIYSECQRDKDAIKWLQSAADTAPDNHKYAYAVANKFFEIGDMQNSLKYYTKAIELDENDCISLKRRAQIYNNLDDDEKAVNDIYKAMKLDPDDSEVYLITGNILTDYIVEDVDDTEEADDNSDADDAGNDNADAATENDNGDESVNDHEEHELSGEEAILNNFDRDSEFYFTKALELDSDSRQGYISRAKYYAEMKEIDKALTDINRAIDLDRDEMDAYFVRGIIFHISGDNDSAIQDFQKTLSHGFMRSQSASYMTKCLNIEQKYDEALSVSTEAIAHDPDFINLYLNRGVAHFNLNQLEEAAEDFKIVISRKNEVSTAAVEAAYRFRGLSFEKLERYNEAILDYRILLKYNPAHTDIKARLNALEKNPEYNPDAPQKKKFSLFKRKNKI